jgi:hypothetical protein
MATWEMPEFPDAEPVYGHNFIGDADDGSAFRQLMAERRAFLNDPHYRPGTDAADPLSKQEAADTVANRPNRSEG